MKRWLRIVVPLAMLVGGVALRVADPAGVVEELRLKVFDTFQRIKPRAYQNAPVRIVDIDDSSLERIGQWPWPRTVVARLVTRLTELGAAVIVFDIVFAEPDRTSPSRVLPLWPDTPDVEALRRNIGALPDHDEILAEAMGRSNVVTAFVLTDGELPRPPALKKGFIHAGDDPQRFLSKFTGAVVSLPEIEAAAVGNGGLNVAAERDGVVRRLPTVMRLGDDLRPSLVLEALRVVQGGGATVIIKSSGASGETSLGEHTGINHVKIGAFVIPTDGQGRMWLHYTPSVPERFIPAWTVLEQGFPREAVEGVIVLIGTSAAGLKDRFATPLDPTAGGVEIHAQALEQIILGDYLVRPDWGKGAEIVFLVALGLFLVVLFPWLGALWCAVIAAGAVAGAFTVSWYAYAQMNLLFDPVYPSAFVLLIYLVESLASFLRSEAEKRQVRDAFSHYMSPDLVAQLAEHPDRLKLGGEMKPMTLLFCDIRDFTAISESHKSDPEGLTRLINRFLTPMTELILDHGGTIDKYMGDCIMAFWNAPLDDIEHAHNACGSALAMIQRLKTLNEEMLAEAQAEGTSHIPIRVGIGLNSGTCCVGNMGAEQRFDYSVLGDDVNLASRLEGQSKTYGVDIVMGEQTYEWADDYAAVELDVIRVKGKREAVRIYALLGEPEMRDSPEFGEFNERHQAMLAAYRGQQWQQARRLVAECRNLNGDVSALYDLYEKRLDAFEADPPGPDWDGVFVAETK
jgi:adenylate cyclase